MRRQLYARTYHDMAIKDWLPRDIKQRLKYATILWLVMLPITLSGLPIGILDLGSFYGFGVMTWLSGSTLFGEYTKTRKAKEFDYSSLAKTRKEFAYSVAISALAAWLIYSGFIDWDKGYWGNRIAFHGYGMGVFGLGLLSYSISSVGVYFIRRQRSLVHRTQ